MPKKEKKGELLKTYNPSGGFTTAPSDFITQKFIEYADDNKTVLEIGAGFGAASLLAHEKRAVVFCNDIEERNLVVVRNRYLAKRKFEKFSFTSDGDKLMLIPGSFPDELECLPRNSFDAILTSRVLHFLSGEKIEQSLKLLFDYLKLDGKLFIVCETPYLKNWQNFLPEYEKGVESGLKWPGEINNPSAFESSGRYTSLPNFVHWLTYEVLERTLIESGFAIEHLSYINRYGQFPEDLLLDGRESIGAIVVKRH